MQRYPRWERAQQVREKKPVPAWVWDEKQRGWWYLTYQIATTDKRKAPSGIASEWFKKYLPTMTSSVTFSMMAAASPATKASKTGALYRFQKRNSSPRLAVVLPTWPNRLAWGFQKILSKHRTTLFKFPKPNLWIAEVFHSGRGGLNWTVLSCPLAGAALSFRTPKGRVHSTTSAVKEDAHMVVGG